MQLPARLLQRKKNSHKNDFGHILILAGSARMLGAAALTSLAAMRSGAGLVTVGIPRSLNSALHKKVSPVVMTLPLNETSTQTLALGALKEIEKVSFDALAIGPGLSRNEQTAKLVLKIISLFQQPMVIDADALNILSSNINILNKSTGIKVLTPHPGEMARLTGIKKEKIEANRIDVAKTFAKKWNCTLLLKGHQTVVADADGKTYINQTGNPGMATAGSGDVLTGIISALLAQGLSGFEAAKFGSYLHGKAGDLGKAKFGKISLLASDIIDFIPAAFKKSI